MIRKHFSRYKIVQVVLSYVEISFYFPITEITLVLGSISS